jgi:hypothetical protein
MTSGLNNKHEVIYMVSKENLPSADYFKKKSNNQNQTLSKYNLPSADYFQNWSKEKQQQKLQQKTTQNNNTADSKNYFKSALDKLKNNFYNMAENTDFVNSLGSNDKPAPQSENINLALKEFAKKRDSFLPGILEGGYKTPQELENDTTYQSALRNYNTYNNALKFAKSRKAANALKSAYQEANRRSNGLVGLENGETEKVTPSEGTGIADRISNGAVSIMSGDVGAAKTLINNIKAAANGKFGVDSRLKNQYAQMKKYGSVMSNLYAQYGIVAQRLPEFKDAEKKYESFKRVYDAASSRYGNKAALDVTNPMAESEAFRNAALKGLSPVSKTIAGGALSAADMASDFMFGPAATSIIAAKAAANSERQQAEEGKSLRKAAARGITSGAVNYGLMAVPYKKVMNSIVLRGLSRKLKEMTPEAIEELSKKLTYTIGSKRAADAYIYRAENGLKLPKIFSDITNKDILKTVFQEIGKDAGIGAVIGSAGELADMALDYVFEGDTDKDGKDIGMAAVEGGIMGGTMGGIKTAAKLPGEIGQLRQVQNREKTFLDESQKEHDRVYKKENAKEQGTNPEQIGEVKPESKESSVSENTEKAAENKPNVYENSPNITEKTDIVPENGQNLTEKAENETTENLVGYAKLRDTENKETKENTAVTEIPEVIAEQYPNKNLGNAGMKAMVENYTPNYDTQTYGSHFEKYYNLGLANIPAEHVLNLKSPVLSESQIKAAYEAGLSDYNAGKANAKATAESNPKAYEVTNTGEGSIKMNSDEEKLTEFIGEKTGLKFKLEKSLPHNAQGVYSKKNGEVSISIKADSFMGSIGHEVTHFIKEYEPEEYYKFRDAVLKFAATGEGKSFYRYFEDYAEKYRDTGDVSNDEILDEMTADSFQKVIGNEKFRDYILKKSKTIGQKIVDFIKDVIKAIKNLIAGPNEYSKMSEDLEKDLEFANKAYDMWIDGFEKAGIKYKGEKEVSAKDSKFMAEAQAGLKENVSNKNSTEVKENVNSEPDKILNKILKNEGDLKYNLSDGKTNYESTPEIYKDMPDEERANVLEKEKIVPAEYKEGLLTEEETDELERAVLKKNVLGKTYAKAIAKELYKKFGLDTKKLFNSKLQLEFEFSKNDLSESTTKQQGNYKDFGKMLAVLPEAAETAIPIKVQNDRYGRKEIENLHILLGGILDNGNMFPVKFEVKEYNTKETAKLYLAVTIFPYETKKTDVVTLPTKDIKSMPAAARSVFTVSLADVIKNIKTNGGILKYFPDQMLDNEQIKIKKKAIEEERAYMEVRGHNTDYLDKYSFSDISEKDYGKLVRENKRLSEANKLLKEQFELTKGLKLSREDVRKTGREILKKYSSKYDINTFTDNFMRLIEYIGDGVNVDTNEVMAVTTAMARNILEQSTEMNRDMYDEYSDLRKQLKNTKIRINETLEGDIAQAYDGYNNFRKQYFGRLSLSRTSGIPADSLYMELSEKYPELFDSDIENEFDELLRIADVLDSIKPYYENPFEMNMDEAAEYLAEEIYSAYMKMPLEKMTFADKTKMRITALQARYDKALSESREKYKARYKKLSEKEIAKNIEETKRYKADSDKKIKENIERLQKIRNKDRENRQESAERTKLLKLARRLTKMKTTPENMERIKELLGDIDIFSKGMRSNTKNMLSEMKAKLEVAEKDNNFELSRKCHDVIDRLDKKQISDMNIGEVRELVRAAQVIEHEIKTKNKLINDKFKEDIYKTSKRAIKEIDSSKGYKDIWFGDKVNTYKINMLDPKRFFRRLSGYKNDGALMTLYNEINDGSVKEMEIKMKAYEALKKYSEDTEFVKSLKLKKDNEIQIKPGVFITPGMRISLYLMSLDKGNMQHIDGVYEYKNAYIDDEGITHEGEFIKRQGGGLTVPVLKKYYEGNKVRAMDTGTRVHLTKSEIEGIVKGMTSKEKEFAEAVKELFNGGFKEEINKVSLIVFGYEKAINKDYFPITTDSNYTISDSTGGKFDKTINSAGMMKERTAANNPIVLQDIFDIIEQHVKATAKYVGFAMAERDFNKIMNVMIPGYENGVRGAINRKWGRHATEYLTNLMKNIAGSRHGEKSPFDSIRGNFAQGVLSLNPNVALKQTASFPQAAAVLGWEPLLKTIPQLHELPKGEEINKISPVWFYRTHGNLIAEMANSTETLHGPKWVQKYVLGWISAADSITIRALYNASKIYVGSHYPGLKEGSEEYNKHLKEIFEKTVFETQPNYDPVHRPEILRKTNELFKTFTMFKTQSFQNFNIAYDAFENMIYKQKALRELKKTGNKDKEEKAKKEYDEAAKNVVNSVTSLIISTVVFSVMSIIGPYLFYNNGKYIKNKNGNISPETIFKSMADASISSTSGMFLFGSEATDFVTAAIAGGKWYGLTNPTIGAIGNAFEYLMNFINTASKEQLRNNRDIRELTNLKRSGLTNEYNELKSQLEGEGHTGSQITKAVNENMSNVSVLS